MGAADVQVSAAGPNFKMMLLKVSRALVSLLPDHMETIRSTVNCIKSKGCDRTDIKLHTHRYRMCQFQVCLQSVALCSVELQFPSSVLLVF